MTVSLQGRGEDRTATTNSAGQYTFSELRSGDYSVGITGYDDDLYGFEVTTATVTVALQETATVPFRGILLRTASIEGTVTVEGQGIRSVAVTVTGGPKDEEHVRTTNDAGYYMVDELHAGDYAVAISDFAGDMHFDATTQSVSVGLRETATVNFLGTWIRTAGIEGTVTVEGTSLDGITVTLAGEAEAGMKTSDGGQYAFPRPGRSGLQCRHQNPWPPVFYSPCAALDRTSPRRVASPTAVRRSKSESADSRPAPCRSAHAAIRTSVAGTVTPRSRAPAASSYALVQASRSIGSSANTRAKSRSTLRSRVPRAPFQSSS